MQRGSAGLLFILHLDTRAETREVVDAVIERLDLPP